MYNMVATGALSLDDALLRAATKRRGKWRRYIPFLKSDAELAVTEAVGAVSPEGTGGSVAMQPKIDRRKTLLLNDETLGRYLICDECHPIPGDDVLAFQDADGRITIHKRQCATALKLKAALGNNILAAEWGTHKLMLFPATIHVEGIDRTGVMHSMTGVLSQQYNLNIRGLNVVTNNGIFTADIMIEVHDVQNIKDIIRDLKKIKDIDKVTRVN